MESKKNKLLNLTVLINLRNTKMMGLFSTVRNKLGEWAFFHPVYKGYHFFKPSILPLKQAVFDYS